MNRIIKNQTSKFVSYLLLIGLAAITTCQQPDDLSPPVARLGLNSITATFSDMICNDVDCEFTAENPGTGNEIIIPIPFYFPENSTDTVLVERLKNMRIRANLDPNAVLSPALLYMDLTKENRITVTDQRKDKKEYIVRGEIRKSNACLIDEFTVLMPEGELTGIINEANKTISLPWLDDLEPSLAELTLSHHASISPDPRVTPLDWNEELELTVTAHNGVTQNVYTVRKIIPNKLPAGLREGSAKFLFAKKLNADLGITVEHVTGGMAATNDYIILNTRNERSIYIHPKTGVKLGDFDLGAVKANFRNFYTTADAAGNALICNLAGSTFDGTFKVWRLTSLTGSTSLYIDWAASGTEAIGRKLSVFGNIDGNAIITAPLLTGTNQRFARWTVVNGVLTSQVPEIVTMSGLERGWTTNCDIVYTSATNVNADYFVASYSDNTFAWVRGQTNQVNKKLEEIDRNYIPNAVDYIEFNNAKFVTVNWVNSFTWGQADAVWLLDVSSDANFTGNLQTRTCPAVVWESARHIYGGMTLVGVPNTNGTGDVALRVSEDGFYLYLYFLFTNGYVVGYRFDCFDI